MEMKVIPDAGVLEEEMSNAIEVETQPSGVSVERTLDVVGKILADADFAKEVAAHNGWGDDLSQDRTAVLFLACRFQWAVDLLSRQTSTLRAQVEGATTQEANLEG